MKDITEKKDFNEHPEKKSATEQTSRLSGAVFFFLCLIPVFSTIAFGGVDAWALGLNSIFCAVLAILWLADSWISKEFRYHSSLLQIPLVGLLIIGIIQLLPLRSFDNSGNLLSISAVSSLSLDPYSTRFFVIQLVGYIVFFAAALTFINNQKRMQKTVLITIIFGAIMAFAGILQRLASPDAIYGVRPTPQAIPFASFVNQHHFAAFMNLTLGLTLSLLFGKALKKDKSLLLIIAAFLMLVALIFTSSRGGILSFFGVLAFVFLPMFLNRDSGSETHDQKEKRGFRNKFLLLAGAFAAIFAVVGAVFLLGGESSLVRGIGFSGQADISSGRTHFWAIALQIFLDHPIFGAGLNAFGAAFTKYDTWNGAFRVEQAHNDYLQILADAGIAGFACIAAFIYFLFKKVLPHIDSSMSHFRRSAAVGALAGCFGILIHSFFDFPLRTPSNAFFFLMFAAIATVTIHQPKNERRHRQR
ncbi:MAG: O-antigen ligase family protein [Pyrinomonadaceae bacterium]|nr:O-antigen ligase family protein [Pyrinomonadaceae bacterium]